MAMRGVVRTAGPAASLIEISRVLEETARLVREHAGEPAERPSRDERVAVSASKVRAIIAARLLRREFLGHDANDAVWSMMLELYAARLEGRRVSQTMLGIAAAVPQTTALRLIRKLIGRGIFETGSDPDDDRLLILALSDSTADRIRAYLNAVQGAA